MELVLKGRLNKQIAGDLGVSEKTVEVHRSRVMAKMKATNAADLARIVLKVKQIEAMLIDKFRQICGRKTTTQPVAAGTGSNAPPSLIP